MPFQANNEDHDHAARRSAGFDRLEAARSATPEVLDSRWALENGEDATLKVDDWTRLMAVREVDEAGSFAATLGRFAGRSWPNLVRELFAELFEPSTDELEESELGPDAPWVGEVREAAHELDTWQALVDRCEGEPMLAGMAADTLATALADKFPPPENDATAAAGRAEDAHERAQNTPTPEMMRKAAEAARQAQEAADVVQGAADRLEANRGAVRQALRGAVDKAAEAVDDLNRTASAFGWGSHAAEGLKVAGTNREFVKAMNENSNLKKIMAIAGRLRTRARTAKKSKTNRQPERLVGITTGGDVARLLPSEIGLLASPATENLLYRKLMERGALQHELEGNENVSKGPIIFCLDESGSMAGAKDQLAKAAALSMMEIAGREKRPFALVHFDGSVSRVDLYRPGKAMALDALLGMLLHFSGGGTSFTAPLARAVKLIETDSALGKADVILLSDGAAGHPTAEIAKLKAAGAALHGIAIAGEFPKELQAECETYVSGATEATFDGILAV